MEDGDSGIHALPDPAGDFTGQVEGEDFCQRFKATLSEKDVAILGLRVEGYGYQEIADKLGYKTHSAVVKRMEAIKKRFIQYEHDTPTFPSTRLKRLPAVSCRTFSLSTRARRASGNLPNGRSGGKGRSGRKNRIRTKRAGAPWKRLRPPFLRSWGLLLLPGASRFGGRLALYPVAEIGAFVSLEENQ